MDDQESDDAAHGAAAERPSTEMGWRTSSDARGGPPVTRERVWGRGLGGGGSGRGPAQPAAPNEVPRLVRRVTG